MAAGYLNVNGLNYAGIYGYYWSRTAADGTHAYYNRFTDNSLSVATVNATRYNGMSVRCLADMTNNTPHGGNGGSSNNTTTSGDKLLEDGNGNIDDTRDLTFAIKFGEDAVAGEYSGVVHLSLTATPGTAFDYTINYNCGPEVNCSNLPNPTSAEQVYTDAWKTNLSDKTPTYNGYNFLGWSKTSYPVGTGTPDFQPNDPIIFCATSAAKDADGECTFTGGEVTIAAVWEEDGPTVKGFGTGNYYIRKMQDMTKEVCDSVTGTGDQLKGSLYDVRDNKVYTVQKLADGSCWMTQNLALDIRPCLKNNKA